MANFFSQLFVALLSTDACRDLLAGIIGKMQPGAADALSMKAQEVRNDAAALQSQPAHQGAEPQARPGRRPGA